MWRESSSHFSDRREAGRVLASMLRHYAGRPDVVVLALPRGGVPVAFEVADALDAPLDIFLVRKLGMPGHSEFAIGALASGGVRVLNDEAVRAYNVPAHAIERIARDEQVELERREREYRQGRALPDLAGRTVMLIDDGLATGSTMRAAVRAVRQLGPARIVVAVPVGAPSTCDELGRVADEVVCARMPESFSAVGQWYRNFSQTTDEEVRALLQQRAGHSRAGGARS
jgi:putative phosphoribosyl transferase